MIRSDLGLKTWISVRLDGWTNHQRELVRDWKIEDWAAWREVGTEFGEASELDESERQRRDLVVIRYIAQQPKREVNGAIYSAAYSLGLHLAALKADKEKNPHHYEDSLIL